MSSSILITGGAGFIGCALATRLVAEGYRVMALDVLHPQVHPRRGRPPRLPRQVELVPADVTVASSWDALLKLTVPDQIVHLAAETGTAQSLTQASRHGRVNVVGTTEMLDALFRADAVPGQIVLASSRAVYGEGDWVDATGRTYVPGVRKHQDLTAGQWDPLGADGVPGVPRPSRADRTTPSPTSVYGATKLAQEHILAAWAAATGANLSILRLQNVYGPGQSTTNSYTGVVTLFAQTAMSGGQIEVYEDGQIVRDFVYVADVVDALVATIDRPADARGVLDIGSGVATTIHELAKNIATSLGAPAPIVTGRFRDGDVRAASTEIEPAGAQLAFRPRWTLRDGLDALLSGLRDDADAG